MRIPRTRTETGDTNMGYTMAIRQKRIVRRGDVAVKIVERSDEGRIIGLRKERFDITEGFVDDIIYGPAPKIKGAMPIGPKPGNKYAALYAQKGVCAKIVTRKLAPKARWTNAITGQVEEMEFDVIFNPLAFPSRMTIGLMYELFIAGTLDYLFNLRSIVSENSMKELYDNNKPAFDREMR